MKIKLFYVASDNWIDSEFTGVYTEKDFEDLKKQAIEKYRNCYDYVYDIQKSISEDLICMAALGREEQVKEFKEEVNILEEQTLTDFINDCVTIYEKEV